MSKELEAFDRVWEDCSKLDLDYVSKHNLMDDLREIKKALTTPTADEVCMALSECLITKVVYKHKTKTFSLRESTFNVELVSYYYDEDKKDYVMHFEFAEPLPPHLIVMIGRFYEGVRK